VRSGGGQTAARVRRSARRRTARADHEGRERRVAHGAIKARSSRAAMRGSRCHRGPSSSSRLFQVSCPIKRNRA